MPIPTPFHPRTSALCTSYRWKEWAGYYAVCSYDTYHEREYFAFRQAAGLLDVTPLFKYEVYGPDAGAFLSHVVAKNVSKLAIGQMTYCCWCDEFGKVVDDGTVARLDDQYFRMTAAMPTLYWLERYRRGFNVRIEDSSDKLAALAIQGPNSRAVLKQISNANLDKLKFFRITKCSLDGIDVFISRTGYTGDLGYEVWVQNEHALKVWDAIMSAGRAYGLEAAGLDALDITRNEAGFILLGVDYFSAPLCLTEERKSSPYEIGLGWTVNLDRDFVGHEALRAENERGPKWLFVGLVLDWDEYEALFAKHKLPPEVKNTAWRSAVPVYNGAMVQVGQATSGTWSPTLKKNLALATVLSEYGKVGTELRMEVTVEYERKSVKATVTELPFFNPERKRA